MKLFNANPKGWKTDDCVIRAIALATNQSWDKVFIDLNEIAFKKKRVFNDSAVYNEYLKLIGWNKQSQPRERYYNNGYYDTYKKYTVYDFIRELNSKLITGGWEYESYIITVAHHMTCVKLNEDKTKYELYDTWDCGEKTIRNYWIKEI